MRPDLVEWELTRACDLRCRHCYARPGRPRPLELDTGRALAMAGDLAGLGCRSVTLSGGEPTLRSDWPAIARTLADADVTVQMATNGQRFGLPQARLARSAGIHAVLVSLDGTRETHDEIRRREGAFDSVCRAMDALTRAGVNFGFITTALRSSIEDLEPLARFISSSGAFLWQLWLGIPQDRSARWLDPTGAARLARMIPDLREICPVLIPGDSLRHLVRSRQPGCESGRRVLGIQSDGTLRGCLALGKHRRSTRSPHPHMCRALSLSPFGTREWPCRSIARAAASALAASTIALGCGPPTPPPGDVTHEQPVVTTQDASTEPAQDTRVADRVDPSADPPAEQQLVIDLDEPCICVSKERNPDGTPVSETPCMCVSHMMCPPSTMWICPPDTEKKIQYVKPAEPD